MKPTMKPPAKTPADTPEESASIDAAAASSALDHDGDGRMGGAAPPPARQPMVVLKDSASLGLTHGEVIRATPADAKSLLAKDQARNATEAEVELAQPRVRDWDA